MSDIYAACRASILRFVSVNPNCLAAHIRDACVMGRVTSEMLRRALREMTADGSIVATGCPSWRRYTVGTPVVVDESEAIEHFEAHGALGRQILDLARRHHASPTEILHGRSPAAGKVRGIIIGQLRGDGRDIARAFRVSETTVGVYRATRSEIA